MSFTEERLLPPSTPESMKHRFLVPNYHTEPQSVDTFTFVTYNVLADCYAQRDYASTYDPQHINAEFRHLQVMKELEYLDGDIVCLQEVSVDFYEEKLWDWFTSRGYNCHFIDRYSYEEGCATFYRSGKFTCKSVHLIELAKVTNELFKHVELDDDMRTTVAERYKMHDVAIVTELNRTGTDSVITIANTHVLYGGFLKPDLQVLQICCLKWLLNQKFHGSPAILCGDFNMWPNSPQYIFTTEDYLPDEQWDILRNKAQIQSDLVDVLKKVVSQSYGRPLFKSAYKQLKGEEPEVTCVDNIFRLCLDYIFCRDQVMVDFSREDIESSPGQNLNNGAVSKLSPIQVLDTLPLEHILKDVPPSPMYSSDHFPLLVKFAFIY